MLRHIIAASAILLGTTFGAAALPAASGLAAPQAEAPLVQVKRGGKHGWGGHRGRHYGWERGRHRGWYKHHRRHGWHPAHRRAWY